MRSAPDGIDRRETAPRPATPGLTVAAALLLLAFVAGPARPQTAVPKPATLEEAVESLRRGPGCHVRIDTVFEAGGNVLSELHATGVYRSEGTYRFSATARRAGTTTEFRVVRIGDRLWLWHSDQGGWRAVGAEPEPIVDTVEDFLRALPALEATAAPQETDFRGAACHAHAFRIPPGGATVQGMPVEGAGTLYVARETGYAVGLELQIRTPANATGKLTALFTDYGAGVEVVPPGLGMAPDEAEAPALTAAGLATRLAAQEAVRVEALLTATGMASAGTGLPARLTVTALPPRRFAVVELESAGKRTDEIVVLDRVTFLHSSATDGHPATWRVEEQPPGGSPAWDAPAEAIRQGLGDRTLTDPSPELSGGRCVWSYAVDPLLPAPVGVLLPRALGAFPDQERDAFGRLLLGRDTGLPERLDLGVTIYPSEADTVSVRERYTFAYVVPQSERPRMDLLLAWANAEVERRRATMEATETAARRIAEEAPDAMGDAAFLTRRLGRMAARYEIGAMRVQDPLGRVIASTGEPQPADPSSSSASIEAAGDDLVRSWTAGIYQCVAPIRRGGETVGFVVAESRPYAPTAPTPDEELPGNPGK